jgi:hypothetical protein
MYHFIYLLLDIHIFRCNLSVYIDNIYIQKELEGPLFFAPKISRPPLLPIDPFHDQFYRKINT